MQQRQSKLRKEYFLRNKKGQEDFGVYADEAEFRNETFIEVKKHQMPHKRHRNIVAIICKSEFSDAVRGSGVLISKDLVLTCAHLLCKKLPYGGKEKFKPHQILIYHAPCGEIKIPCNVQKYYIPDSYMTVENERSIYYDFALIKLSKKIQSADFMPLKPDQKLEKNLKIAIFGYPNASYSRQIQGNGDVQSVAQRGLIKQNAVLAIREKKCEIVHIVPTSAGHSGSPIIAIQGDQVCVIGIHKAMTSTKINNQVIQANSGKYFSTKLIRHLRQQAKKLGAELFEIYKQFNNRPSRPQYTQKINYGDAYFQSRMWEKAICFYKKAIQVQATSQAFYKLGLTYFTAQEFHQAVEHFIKAISLQPNFAEAYYNLANSLRKTNNLEEAITNYLHAVDYQKDFCQAYNNLAIIYYDRKDFKKAIEYYHEAIRISPGNAVYYNNLANALDQNQQKQDAILHYRKAIEINQNYLPAYMNLGLVLQSLQGQKNISNAVELYRKVIEIDKDYANAYRCLGKALIKLESKAQAVAALQKYLQFDQQNGSIINKIKKLKQKQRK